MLARLYHASSLFVWLALLIPTAVFGQVGQGADSRPFQLNESFVVEGACPFECCSYNPEWRAEEEIAVYSAPRDTSTMFAKLAPETIFSATGGNVHVDPIGIYVVEERIKDRWDPIELLPGDTIFVFDYMSEGYWNYWHDGRFLYGQAFWDESDFDYVWPPNKDIKARAIRQVGHEWWVSVVTPAGEAGWIRMADAKVSGNYHC